MVRRTKEEAQETRSQILEAAEKAFYERGVARTTLADIARSAKESGEQVKITFTVGQYGNKVTGLELAEKAAA